MTAEDFVALALANAANATILSRLPEFDLPDAWLVSGCLFQTAWNLHTGRDPMFGIKDYDIFYFDRDTSWEKEDRVIHRVQRAFADMGIALEPRNQARVHLWYAEKFGTAYPPLTKSTDGIDRFLMPCAQVGIGADGRTVYAPSGFDDIEAMIVRPNRKAANFQPERYREKAERWKTVWPELTVLSV